MIDERKKADEEITKYLVEFYDRRFKSRFSTTGYL